MTRFPGDIQRVGLGWDAGCEPLLAVTRGGAVESVHRGVVAVTDARGRLLGGVGDPDLPIHLRSAAKPFQAVASRGLGRRSGDGIHRRGTGRGLWISRR